jgi:TonB-dependent starch-binding outer membrane protein SusC
MTKKVTTKRLLPAVKLAGMAYLSVFSFFPLQAQVASASADYNEAEQQQTRESKITLQVKNEKLSAVLDRIEKMSGYVFVYSTDEINAAQKVSINVKEKPLADVLRELLPPLNILHEILNDKIILKPTKQPNPLPDGGTVKNETVTVASGEPVTAVKRNIGISGRAVTEGGAAVEGVSVTVKGSSLGTVTNNEGYFTLSIPDDQANGILVFSSVGYETLEVGIANRKSITVTLISSDKKLGEIVVVGYGTQRRGSITGAVDAVGRKAIEGRPVTNLSTALQGTSPNLIIQQTNFEPGQPVNINIRGIGTLGNNSPLVVIDGIIGGDINLINPNDIESVSILKDAGTAAIYGSRSANGVVLITTKRGKKNQKPVVSYTGNYGIQSPRITFKPVDAWANAYYKNESLANSGLSPAFTPQQIRDFQTRGNGDWRAETILQNAPQQSHNISFSGGSANNTYLVSFGYLDQQSNFVGQNFGYKRYNIRLNQSTEIGKFRLNTILSYVKVNNRDHAFNASTLMVDATRVPLYYSFKDTAGNYLTNPVSAQFNPLGILENGGFRTNNDDEIFGNITGELSVTKDLKLRGVFGGTVRSNTAYEQQKQLNFIPGGVWGNDRQVTDNNAKSLFTNLQLIAEYTKQIKNHDIKVLIGGSNESFRSEESRLSRQRANQLGVATSDTFNLGNTFNSVARTVETSLNSVFGRAGYSYSGRYFAEFNFRYDGSSNFPSSNRWGFFPSAAVAWKITDEAFMKNYANKIGDLKLRASYGLLGNQNIDPYRYQTTFQNTSTPVYGFNNIPAGGINFLLGNPDVTWEKAANFNIGVDASFLKRKLEVSFDYFDKRTRDILNRLEGIPLIFGATGNLPPYNIATVRNRGWEFRATYYLTGKTFNHSFSVNLADNLNELVSLGTGATEIVLPKEEFQVVRRVGQPITVYQGYQTNGFFQNLKDIQDYPKIPGTNPTAGDLKFVDRNGDGIINDLDKTILGNPFPRYTFGFTYTLNVKGFDVVLFVQGVGKREQMIRGEQVEPFHFGYGGTVYEHQTDYWTPTNPNARWPRLSEANSASNVINYRQGSDIYLFDAAYARLKNLQIGYTIPPAITQKIKLQKVRAYFTGQNLLTLSKLDFLDPEITEFNSDTNPFIVGANSARAYFMPRFIGFGLDITF